MLQQDRSQLVCHQNVHQVSASPNQCMCLQDSWNRMNLDMERSRREGFHFGVKLVRGAYMYLERQRAKELKFTSPVWESLEETHANYNRFACLH